MKKKIRAIQILRIIACLGVFTGHFLGIALPSKVSMNFLIYLRNSWISRTVLSYFYQGDTNVIIFYVIGGFFLVYSLKKAKNFKDICMKLFSRILNLLIPSLVIIVFSAVIYLILNKFGNCRFSFDLQELQNDLKQLFVSGEGIYYAYQLWYIRVMLRCYVIGTIVMFCIMKKESVKYIIYIVCLLSFFVLQSAAYFAIVVGMIVADYGETVITAGKKIRYSSCIAFLLFMLAPFIYNEQHLGEINKMILAIAIAGGIFFLFVAEVNAMEISVVKGKIIDWLDENSYAFYLVHVLVQEIVSYPIYELLMYKFAKQEILVLIVDYMFSVFLCWGGACIFNKVIVKKVRGLFLLLKHRG